MRSVVHYYARVEVLLVDIEAAGLRVADVEQVTLDSPPASAADVAAGYRFGTPFRFEIESRGGNLDTVYRAIASEIEALMGADPVTGRMQAQVVTATSPG